MNGLKIGQTFQIRWSNDLHTRLQRFIQEEAQLGAVGDCSTPELLQQEAYRRRVQAERIADLLGMLLERHGVTTITHELSVLDKMEALRLTVAANQPIDTDQLHVHALTDGVDRDGAVPGPL